MSIDWGFNFRQTSGFVVDGAGETYVTGGDSYPTTRAGQGPFGYEDAGTADRDRNAGNDRRLAGLVESGGSNRLFRLDLPSAGTYTIHLAVGDASFASSAYGTDPYWDWFLRDDTTNLLHVTGATAANSFLDATLTPYTAALWPSSEAGVNLTFSTTILRVYVPTADTKGMINHLRVVTFSPPPPVNAVWLLKA